MFSHLSVTLTYSDVVLSVDIMVSKGGRIRLGGPKDASLKQGKEHGEPVTRHSYAAVTRGSVNAVYFWLLPQVLIHRSSHFIFYIADNIILPI